MKTTRFAAVAASALLVLAACGDEDEGTSASDTGTIAATAGNSVTATDEAFPVTIENCGIETTYDAAPTAAVTMNGHVTEILLALGLEDSMVGTAYIDSGVRDDLEAAYESVPVLADEYPSREEVLAAEPDIVIGGYSSAFGDEAAGSRESLEEAGIDSYLTSGYCPDFAEPQSLELVAEDITELGTIFGVPDRAADVVAAIDETVAGVTEALDGVDPVDVFVYDSGTELAFTAASFENTTALIDLAGGHNVFDDVEDSFTEVSWEDVVARDPDVILILDYADSGTVEEKEAFLQTHPVASTLRAVQEGNFVVVGLGEVVPGVRNGDTVATLASALHPDVNFGR